MFGFMKKKVEAPKEESTGEEVRRRLSETGTKLDEAVKKMQERIAQRAMALAPQKVK